MTGCSSNPLETPAHPRSEAPHSRRYRRRCRRTRPGRCYRSAGRAAAAVFDGGTHQLVVLTPGSVTVFGRRATSTSRDSPCQGRRRRWASDGSGTAYGRRPGGGYVVVDLSAGPQGRS